MSTSINLYQTTPRVANEQIFLINHFWSHACLPTLTATRQTTASTSCINDKKLKIIPCVNSYASKKAKNDKKGYYPPSCCLYINMMLVISTFYSMIFAFFDARLLTQWINCTS